MLKEIHFILTYRCNFECDHCFLYCSPYSQGTFTTGQVKTVIKDTQKIKSVNGIGFEGGEPFLFFPLLLESVRYASLKGFDTSIQTNTYWAINEEDANLWLRPLKESGLSLLEVSDDEFHHGKDEQNSAKRAQSAARKLGLKVNTLCIKEPAVGSAPDSVRGEPIYTGGPKLRGRAVDKFVQGLPTRHWELLASCPFEDLAHPKRVHVDAFGNVHICQGLSMGNMWKTPLSQMVKTYDSDAHPVCGPLLKGGPAQLIRQYGLEHDAQYVDACHLCTHACKLLVEKFPQYITPPQVYGLKTKG